MASSLTPAARFLTSGAYIGHKLPKRKEKYQIMYQNQLNKEYIQQTTFRLDLPDLPVNKTAEPTTMNDSKQQQFSK